LVIVKLGVGWAYVWPALGVGGADVDRSSIVDFVDFAASDGCYIEVIEE
jgi:hypothetical protein